METTSQILRHYLHSYAEAQRKEAEAQLFYLLKNKYQYSRLDYLKDVELELTQKRRLQLDLNLLKDHYPVQHIVGFTYFKSFKIKVNRDVLIPRQETEELVDIILKHEGLKRTKALDLATGSGCIAIALSEHFKDIYALDKSEAALDLAKENAHWNGKEISIFKDDILNPSKQWPSQLDLIVSNPPYVRQKERLDMSKIVLDHEPHQALFVEDDDPLIFYDAIAKYAQEALQPDGLLAFEINQYLPSQTKTLLLQYFKQVKLQKDSFENYRFAFCWGLK